MDEEKTTRNYYAIIPANVRYDSDLPATARLLYGEITALCNERGYCWATNSYFADLYEVTNRTASSWISLLAKKGYIHVKIIKDKETKEIKGRYISIINKEVIDEIVNNDEKLTTPIENNFHTPRKNIPDPIENNFHTPMEENFYKNNTVINNTINNTVNKGEKRKRFVPPTLEEVKAYCKERNNKVDPERWLNYYTANGWHVGRNKMKDWKAAVRTWERNSFGFDSNKQTGKNGIAINEETTKESADFWAQVRKDSGADEGNKLK